MVEGDAKKMSYKISTKKIKYLNPMPLNTAEEVIQNVRMILNTIAGSCPMYREFGLSPLYLDKPEPIAKNLIVAEIYDKVELYEPRAEVEGVTFEESDLPGMILPVVEVNIKNA